MVKATRPSGEFTINPKEYLTHKNRTQTPKHTYMPKKFGKKGKLKKNKSKAVVYGSVRFFIYLFLVVLPLPTLLSFEFISYYTCCLLLIYLYTLRFLVQNHFNSRFLLWRIFSGLSLRYNRSSAYCSESARTL